MKTKMNRIIAVIVKEFILLFRDPRSRIILFGPPLLQLFIFAFAATLEVKNVSLVIFNEDNGQHGYEIVQRLVGSSTFSHINFVDNLAAITPYLDQQKAIAAIHIPQDFSKQLESNLASTLQVVLDGRRSNAAQIVNGYIGQIANRYGEELIEKTGQNIPFKIENRNWFNENLLYIWFTVPSLVAILSMLITLAVSSLSLAREKELGIFEQLLVSPLRPHEILLGKLIPAIVIGLLEGIMIWTVAVLIFQIPFQGSFSLLLLVLFIFVISVVGVGLFISSLCKTQQQAILGTFIFMVPAVTLSGYAAPVENMPHWLQQLVWFNPLKHALISIKGLFLKDFSFYEIWLNTWPLLVISLITLSAATWLFKKII